MEIKTKYLLTWVIVMFITWGMVFTERDLLHNAELSIWPYAMFVMGTICLFIGLSLKEISDSAVRIP